MSSIRFVAALALICTNSLFAGKPSGDATPIDGKKAQSKYVIEPPDVVSIEVPRLVPNAYRVAACDVVTINVANSLRDAPLNSDYMIEADGTISLGSPYGSVRLVGMTIDEVIQAIDKHLQKFIDKPDGSVQLMRACGAQPITGQYLVGPDGTINLRQYGVVHIAGRTVIEARIVIQDHLKQFLDSPEPSVEVVAFNSKVYYVITRKAGEGESVRRLPLTGNETVLDAISQVNGLSQVSSKKIWIARPAAHHFGGQQILPIDWDAITQGAQTATNFQILPGDRLFVGTEEQKVEPKQTAEPEQNTTQTIGRDYNRTRAGL